MKLLLLLLLSFTFTAEASVFGTTEFLLEVAKGKIPKHTSNPKVGHADGVGTTRQTLWYEGGIVTFPAAATIMTISSDDSNDTSAGTGCRTLYISGLDSSWLEVSETRSLNGVNAVNTVNSYLRINSLVCDTAGALLKNVGNVYIGVGIVAAGKPATVYNLIPPDHSISHSGFYSVPANKKSYLAEILFTVSANKDAEVYFLTRDNSVADKPWIEASSFDVIGATSPSPSYGFAFQPKTDIKIEAEMSTGSGNIKVIGLLIDVEN